MKEFSKVIRKNIGTIISIIGIILLVILTYGDMGELFTDKYWENVGGNITSIGALTIGLVLIQVSIKQGVSEQALITGLNTPDTKAKYDEHKNIKKKCASRLLYLPHFLSARNKRETERRKREFLVDNNFTSESFLYNMDTCLNFFEKLKRKKLIKEYEHIQTNITPDSINWSTTDIVHNKNGRIERLETYRKKRAVKATITALIWMLGTTLITGGLFLDPTDIPFWQKTAKLLTYLISMALSVFFDISKNYEKGAFGVPNELDEINGIWEEFQNWSIPAWVKEEVEKEEIQNILEEQPNQEIAETEEIKNNEEEEIDESREETINTRTDLQEESIQSQNI